MSQERREAPAKGCVLARGVAGESRDYAAHRTSPSKGMFNSVRVPLGPPPSLTQSLSRPTPP